MDIKIKRKGTKVGGITFHRAINYGAILQAYALQEVLKKLGCEYYILDYRNPEFAKKYKRKTFRDIKSLKDIFRYIFYWGYYNKKYDKFREFSLKYLNLSKPFNSAQELNEINAEYDKFVCGSDQVWNYKLTNFDKMYFLDFVESNDKKNSYAASFGFSEVPDHKMDEYCKLLESFNHLSIREEQGKKIIKKLINRDAEVVLDPTMLLAKEEWEELACEYEDRDYILVYRFSGSKKMDTFIEKLSQETGCRIVIISYSLKRRLKAKYEKIVGPLEFLGLFKNAKYVVTNSFHGTAFSILFNKDFFIEMLPESRGVNSRLVNLLNLFNLQSREIIDGQNKYIHKEIDYTYINKKLEKERASSIQFIRKIIDGENK